MIPTRAFKLCCLLFLSLTAAGILAAEKGSKPSKGSKKPQAETRMKADTFTGLAFRGIGPAVTSGRVGDIAVHPTDRNTWYVAVASGGVWKTVNAGVTWTPIFDGESAYSIRCLTMDPQNPLGHWVGTGAHNAQRR